ncbi:MAG: TIGR04282 family arsenosugar biosynthesis glycosyltransferase [Acidobacteriaceae bacterium]
MAKAPRPGKVKTRLSPPLTAEQAAELNIALLRDTATCLAEAALSGHAAAVVSYTPVGDEALFEGVLPEAFLLIPQRGDTFGERLLATAEDLFACGFTSVCLIDSDSPTVPQAAYRTALQALSAPGNRVVLGPTVDGGYYLIGIKQPDPRLFQQIAWSTGAVYSQTASNASEANYDIVELPLWYDVDDAATLSLLRAELIAGVVPDFATAPGYSASNTRALLIRMGGVVPTGGSSADTPLRAAQGASPQPVSAAGEDL